VTADATASTPFDTIEVSAEPREEKSQLYAPAMDSISITDNSFINAP
jgi:hypothetical protein